MVNSSKKDIDEEKGKTTKERPPKGREEGNRISISIMCVHLKGKTKRTVQK